jgi:uncharacterized membrane protein
MDSAFASAVLGYPTVDSVRGHVPLWRVIVALALALIAVFTILQSVIYYPTAILEVLGLSLILAALIFYSLTPWGSAIFVYRTRGVRNIGLQILATTLLMLVLLALQQVLGYETSSVVLGPIFLLHSVLAYRAWRHTPLADELEEAR